MAEQSTDGAGVGVGVGAWVGAWVGAGDHRDEGDAVCPEQPASVTHRAAAAATEITCFKVIRA